MSFSQRMATPTTNSPTTFELASASTLRQKGVTEWRDYNRLLTAEYETVLIERDALKRKNITLERDVRELEVALEASDGTATAPQTVSSEDVEAAHAKIAALESALAEAQAASDKAEADSRELVSALEEAQADLQDAYTDNTSLRSALEARGQGSMDARGSPKSITQGLPPPRAEEKQAEADDSVSPPPPDYRGPPPPNSVSSEEVVQFGADVSDVESGAESQEEFEPEGPANEEPGRSSDLSGSLTGRSSRSTGQRTLAFLSPAADRPTVQLPEERFQLFGTPKNAAKAKLDTGLEAGLGSLQIDPLSSPSSSASPLRTVPQVNLPAKSGLQWKPPGKPQSSTIPTPAPLGTNKQLQLEQPRQSANPLLQDKKRRQHRVPPVGSSGAASTHPGPKKQYAQALVAEAPPKTKTESQLDSEGFKTVIRNKQGYKGKAPDDSASDVSASLDPGSDVPVVDSEASPSPSQQDEDVIGNTLDDETGWTDEDLSDGYIRDAQQGFKDRHPDLQLVQTEFVPGTAHPTVPYPRREATAPPRKKTWETDSNWRDRS